MANHYRFLCDSRAYHDMMYWTVEKEAVGKSFPHITAAPYPAHIHLDPAFPLTRLQKTRDIAVFATWQNRPVNFDNPNVRSELGVASAHACPFDIFFNKQLDDSSIGLTCFFLVLQQGSAAPVI
jgi:hypothetical protein